MSNLLPLVARATLMANSLADATTLCRSLVKDPIAQLIEVSILSICCK